MDDDHNFENFDGIFQSRIRLAILSVLIAVEKAEFTFLKEKTKATDGNLGAHLKKLEDVKYIKTQKKFVDRKPVSFYSITNAGRDAVENYINTIEQLFGKK